VDVTVGKDGTSVSLTPSANPAAVGQTITFKAVVSPLFTGSGTPTESVIFYYGGTYLGMATLIGGAATLPVNSLPVGKDAITASYSGDSDLLGQSAQVVETITPPVTLKFGTRTTLVTSPKSATVGHLVTLTATVKPIGPVGGYPSGNVAFTDGGITLHTSSLSRGRATFKTSSLHLGTNQIEVIYSGDKHFNGGMSLPLIETITKPAKKAKPARPGNLRSLDRPLRSMQRSPQLKEIRGRKSRGARESPGSMAARD